MWSESFPTSEPYLTTEPIDWSAPILLSEPMFLFPTPPTARLLTRPSDGERREMRTLAPYLPSDPVVVDAMLDLADVGPDDVVMDLGCGDGRIVFAAARRGARAIGVDIDPCFVLDNRHRARHDPRLAQASFICADMLTVDLSEATVVTCYLLGRAMDALQPKFETSLKPGTRIVSHAFMLGEGWEPVKRAFPEHRLSTVYLWIV